MYNSHIYSLNGLFHTVPRRLFSSKMCNICYSFLQQFHTDKKPESSLSARKSAGGGDITRSPRQDNKMEIIVRPNCLLW